LASGIEPGHGRIDGFAVLELSGLDVGLGQRVADLEVVGLGLLRFEEGGDGPVMLFELRPADAESQLGGPSVGRPEADVLFIGRGGLGEIGDGLIGAAEVEIDLLAGVAQRRRLVQRFGRVLELRLLEQDRSQAVKGLGPVRIELGDRPVGRHRLGVIPLPGIDLGEDEMPLEVGRIDLDRSFDVDPGRHLLVERQGRRPRSCSPRLSRNSHGSGLDRRLSRPGHADEGGDGRQNLRLRFFSPAKTMPVAGR
jgi:hypothetical protein